MAKCHMSPSSLERFVIISLSANFVGNIRNYILHIINLNVEGLKVGTTLDLLLVFSTCLNIGYVAHIPQ